MLVNSSLKAASVINLVDEMDPRNNISIHQHD
jgi:hypothetical protein